MSSRVNAITQVDLISVENGYIYFWNVNKKLLSYQSDSVFAFFYYYNDNEGFTLSISLSSSNGNENQSFYYRPEKNKFININNVECWHCWYCYEHDLILKTSRYNYYYDDSCETNLSCDNVDVQLKGKNSWLLSGKMVPDLVKNYMIDYCSLPLEHY